MQAGVLLSAFTPRGLGQHLAAFGDHARQLGPLCGARCGHLHLAYDEHAGVAMPTRAKTQRVHACAGGMHRAACCRGVEGGRSCAWLHTSA